MDEECQHCISLRLYIEAQIKSLTDQFLQYAEYNSDRLQRTEKDLERRLEAMNEFRGQLSRQASTFLTREYYDTKHEAFDHRLRGLEQGWWTILGAATVLSLAAEVLLHALWR